MITDCWVQNRSFSSVIRLGISKFNLCGIVLSKKIFHHVYSIFFPTLFPFDSFSPGSWFFLPHGTRIYNKLMDFIRNQYRERGYQEVCSLCYVSDGMWWYLYLCTPNLLVTCRFYHQTCIICNYGRHLVMLQITRRICLYLRWCSYFYIISCCCG